MTTRRDLLKSGGALVMAGVGMGMADGKEVTPARKPKRLRTITYNVLACMGYRDKDDKRKRLRPDIPREQMSQRFALELGLYRPDIVSFQESTGEQGVADIAKGLGLKHHCYFYSGEAWNGALMSRYPIMEYKNCPLVSYDKRPEKMFTRHWGRALLETDDGPLAFFSAHLFPSGGGAGRREPEVTEMLKVMAKDIDAGRSVLFQGDLNHKPDGQEYERWVKAGFVDSYATKGIGQPFTIPSRDPQARIDYIWSHGALSKRLKECRVLYEGAFRGNPADPRSDILSDHVPVMATFE